MTFGESYTQRVLTRTIAEKEKVYLLGAIAIRTAYASVSLLSTKPTRATGKTEGEQALVDLSGRTEMFTR